VVQLFQGNSLAIIGLGVNVGLIALLNQMSIKEYCEK